MAFALSCPRFGAHAAMQAFSGGLVLDPVYTGDWGTERKQVHGKDLPAFTPDQKALLLENQASLEWDVVGWGTRCAVRTKR